MCERRNTCMFLLRFAECCAPYLFGLGMLLPWFACLVPVSAEALVLSFILRSSFDAKLLYLMLFFLALGLLMFAFGMEKAGGYLCFGVLLSGMALVFRFVLYMNKYCRRDADERLNETT